MTRLAVALLLLLGPRCATVERKGATRVRFDADPDPDPAQR